MRLDEIDDKIIEEIKEVEIVVKKKWYEMKPVILSFFGVIGSTLIQYKDTIVEYFKGLDFKYYIIVLCVFSIITYYGWFKNNKPLEENKDNEVK